MDKNSITGIVLITAILGMFWWMNKPSEIELARQQQYRDSVAIVDKAARVEAEKRAVEARELAKPEEVVLDSAQRAADASAKFGVFTEASEGTQEFITLENKLIKLVVSTQGGSIYSVELKDYKTFDAKPLMLIEPGKNSFGFTFVHNSRVFNTKDLFFKTAKVTASSADFTVEAAEGKMTFSYNLPENSYMADFNITTSNMGNIISTNSSTIELDWMMDVISKEKGVDFERRYSGIYYKFFQDEVEHMSASKANSEELSTKLKWVAFKDQFFSSVLIAKDAFVGGDVKIKVPEDKADLLIMNGQAKVSVPFTGNDKLEFNYYFGPNDFKALKPYEELGLRKLVDLGWGFLRYINLGVIEVFHFLEKFMGNYGLIILILTLLIKLLLFPLTYKSYVSTAKMKVLKPQIDEINERIPKDKAMERQQATMALYRKAGVNPLGGCLPMLLQMPILFAMFQFFPASIELRQESFLWASDLSSYDSILTLPWHIPFYGNHVSLFCLLMSITNVIYTYMNQEMTQSSQQMPGMKTMMYMMPVMFLFFFNSYAAGLSYYYFISTLITIIQTLMIRNFVDEKALLAKITLNQKKPVKKSGFQQRLEDMQRQKNIGSKKK